MKYLRIHLGSIRKCTSKAGAYKEIYRKDHIKNHIILSIDAEK